jgi:hypothetical protein
MPVIAGICYFTDQTMPFPEKRSSTRRYRRYFCYMNEYQVKKQPFFT